MLESLFNKVAGLMSKRMFSVTQYVISEKLTYCDGTYLEAVVQRYSVKKIFLKISQNSQENLCARVSFLIKL